MTLFQILRVAVRDEVELKAYVPSKTLPDCAMIYCEVANFTDKPRPCELSADGLIVRIIRVLKGQASHEKEGGETNHQVLNWRQMHGDR